VRFVAARQSPGPSICPNQVGECVRRIGTGLTGYGSQEPSPRTLGTQGPPLQCPPLLESKVTKTVFRREANMAAWEGRADEGVGGQSPLLFDGQSANTQGRILQGYDRTVL
jgi:hypothetical protein